MVFWRATTLAVPIFCSPSMSAFFSTSPAPARGNLPLVVTELGLEQIIHLRGRLAPQVLRRPQFRLAVMEPQVDGPGGAPAHDDAVETGEAHLGRKEAAGLRGAHPG